MSKTDLHQRRSFMKVSAGIGATPFVTWASSNETPAVKANQPSPLEAQMFRLPNHSEPMIVSGRVTNGSQAPVRGQPIALNSNALEHSTTDADGRFIISTNTSDFKESKLLSAFDNHESLVRHQLTQDHEGVWRLYLDIKG